MSDFKTTVRELGRELEAKQKEAGEQYAALETLRAEAAKEGVDFLKNADAFAKLDETSKVYDATCDEINTLQARYNRSIEIANGPSPQPQVGEAPRSDGSEESFAERFMGSHAWEHIKAVSGPGRNLKFGASPSAEIIKRGEVRGALMTTTSYPSQHFRRPGIIALPQVSLSILDLIPFVETDAETVEYVYEKTYTNTAAETAEGEAAPEGTLDFDDGSVVCRWIPFSIPSTRQLISDEPRMEAWINERLPRGVRTRLQTQIISGNGTAPNLTGIMNWTNILVQDAGADTKADLVHKAKTKILVATNGENTANVLLIHPNDHENLVLEKDANSRYFFGGPSADGIPTIWGMLPVVHPSITEGNPIVLDVGVCEGYVREGVTVSVTDSHSDFFTKSKLMWLAQGRFAFLITRASGVCEITDFDS